MSHDLGPVRLLVRKLQGYDELSRAEVVALARTVSSVRTVGTDQDIVAQGERPGYSSLLVEGWAARYKLLKDGARQITAIHVPGDFVDLHGFLLHELDHGVVALCDCRIAMAPHERLRGITEQHPHLGRLLWFNTLVDASIHREWLVAIGRMAAVNALAHLICEIHTRLEAIGLTDGPRFDFPITQVEVADALGLSNVHVNRSSQELRARNLIRWTSGMIEILDVDQLKAFAQFDPLYLYQTREPR